MTNCNFLTAVSSWVSSQKLMIKRTTTDRIILSTNSSILRGPSQNNRPVMRPCPAPVFSRNGSQNYNKVITKVSGEQIWLRLRSLPRGPRPLLLSTYCLSFSVVTVPLDCFPTFLSWKTVSQRFSSKKDAILVSQCVCGETPAPAASCLLLPVPRLLDSDLLQCRPTGVHVKGIVQARNTNLIGVVLCVHGRVWSLVKGVIPLTMMCYIEWL